MVCFGGEGTASMGGFGGRGACWGFRSLRAGCSGFWRFPCGTGTGLGRPSGVAAALAMAAGAAVLTFFRLGRRGGFGITAFIERLIRFIAASTPMTLILTISPTFTACRASCTYLWE